MKPRTVINRNTTVLHLQELRRMILEGDRPLMIIHSLDALIEDLKPDPLPDSGKKDTMRE